MVHRLCMGLLALGAGAGLIACTSSGGGENCAVGSESCVCTTGGGCDPGLSCLSLRCVRASGGGSGGHSGGGASGSGGAGAAKDSGWSGGAGKDSGWSGGAGYDGGGSSGNGQDSGAGGSGGVSCGESGMYCKDNVLRSCATDMIVVDCATCKWSASASSSSYNTYCRDKAASCSTCDATHPWTGPGCYFGGGPAVCP
jgi:hypothetical protein